MSDNMEELMQQALDEAPDDTSLSRIAALARKQYVLEKQLEEAEEDLKRRKEALNEVRDKELPAAMAEVQMSEFKLDNGYKVTVKDEVYCSQPEDPEPGFAWLREKGFEAIIKNFVLVAFGKGEDKIAAKVCRAIADLGLQPEVKTGVHPSTLKAFIKEQMGKGVVIPLDLFGAYCVTRSKLEMPKEKKE